MFSVSGSLASRDGGTAIPASSETEPKMFADDGELSPIKAETRGAPGGKAAVGAVNEANLRTRLTAS